MITVGLAVDHAEPRLESWEWPDPTGREVVDQPIGGAQPGAGPADAAHPFYVDSSASRRANGWEKSSDWG